MDRLIVSSRAPRDVFSALTEKGFELWGLTGRGVSDPVKTHPDMFLVKIEEELVYAREGELTSGYPAECAFNALFLGGRLFAGTSLSRRVAEAAKRHSVPIVTVRQGYSACSVCRVDDSSAITADRGMAAAMEKGGLSVLLIRPGHIAIDSYDSGFIGGASALVDGELYFFGRVREHPDWERMRRFIEERGVKWHDAPSCPLTDAGGAVKPGKAFDCVSSDAAFTLNRLL